MFWVPSNGNGCHFGRHLLTVSGKQFVKDRDWALEGIYLRGCPWDQLSWESCWLCTGITLWHAFFSGNLCLVWSFQLSDSYSATLTSTQSLQFYNYKMSLFTNWYEFKPTTEYWCATLFILTYRSIRGVSNTRRKQLRENAPPKYRIYVKLPLNANVFFRWSKGLCQLSWDGPST